jgi:hypothetical protein
MLQQRPLANWTPATELIAEARHGDAFTRCIRRGMLRVATNVLSGQRELTRLHQLGKIALKTTPGRHGPTLHTPCGPNVPDLSSPGGGECLEVAWAGLPAHVAGHPGASRPPLARVSWSCCRVKPVEQRRINIFRHDDLAVAMIQIIRLVGAQLCRHLFEPSRNGFISSRQKRVSF